VRLRRIPILRLISLSCGGILGRVVGVPIEVPGLSRFIAEVPDGRLILIEGDMGPSKGFLAARLACSAAAAGRQVTYVTSGRRHDAEERLGMWEGSARPDVVEAEGWPGVEEESDGSQDLVVDGFSFLALDVPPVELARSLRGVAARLARTGGIGVFTVERGMLEPRSAAVAAHLADGLIQFHAREDVDGVVEFLRIPKWMQGVAHPRNIYYGFEGRRLSIDTRRRVN
jgi:KaiC/GvpD/RAD55 family RecA-like ATPase